MSDVNMIVSFKISDDELERWSKTILRLFPHVTAEVIAKITDNFLLGKESFDKDLGIVNYTSRIGNYMGIFQ